MKKIVLCIALLVLSAGTAKAQDDGCSGAVVVVHRRPLVHCVMNSVHQAHDAAHAVVLGQWHPLYSAVTQRQHHPVRTLCHMLRHR